MDLVDAVWGEYAQLAVDDIPPFVKTYAKQVMLDWVGCAVAGSAEPLSGILRAALPVGTGASRVIGTADKALSQFAALINGAAGHALDYDESNPTGGFHPAAAILPAVFALGDEGDRSGAELIAAFVAGTEVAARFGAAIGTEHYAKGWHTTSSIGVFGAAAAAGWLLGLDREQFGSAMGLAASQSSGVQANFATMTKPFHAGHAAERGLLAALLAKAGYEANASAFEAPNGLVNAAGTGEVSRERLDGIEGVWVVTKSLVKYHAACHSAHAAMESCRRMAGRFDPADITAVEVVAHPHEIQACMVDYPVTGLQAKFSLRGAVALALLGDDTASPATFSDERVRAPEVTALIDRTRVVEDASRVTWTGAVVRVQTPAGAFEESFDIGTPETDLAAQEARVRGKFSALAAPVLGARAGELADRLLALESVERISGLDL